MNYSVKRPPRWGVVFGTLLLSGCVSAPPPTDQMTSAKSAVAEAISAGAPEFAPMEMRRAQTKLDDASAAMVAKEYVRARRLSEQAELDAKLASSKARSAKAQREVAKLEQDIRALQAEINRAVP
jgi:septal ring factor EnvC (AmiA/AmiB activator)